MTAKYQTELFCDTPQCRASFRTSVSVELGHLLAALRPAIERGWDVTFPGKHFCPNHNANRHTTVERARRAHVLAAIDRQQ